MADYVINKNTQLNFEVGCGDDTITLGNNDYSTVLNFITDPREGYVSIYSINENADGSILLKRTTGKTNSFGNVTQDITEDTIRIVDFIANGKGKVTFNGLIFKDENLTNVLIEDAINTVKNNSVIYFNTITATENETFQGTWLSERIEGASSHDTIYGNGGNDYIVGKQGNDIIYGGEGVNTIYGDLTSPGTGSSGDDVIYAGNYGDTINTGFGNDKVYGGDGNDEIWFYTGLNNIQEIHGGKGNDKILSRSVSSSSGVANLWGDEGEDIFFINDSAKTGSYILKDADNNDTLRIQQQNNTTYTYNKNNQDLDIIQTINDKVMTVTLKDHFTKLANGTQLNKFFITGTSGKIKEDLSLLENAVVNVTVENGTTYSTTAYKENITVKQGENQTVIVLDSNSQIDNITGLSANDRIKFLNKDFSDLTFEKDGNNLKISYGETDKAIINGFLKKVRLLIPL